MNLVVFLPLFLALSHAGDIIFRSKMGAAGISQWTTNGGCDKDKTGDYCITDTDGTKECTEIKNGCFVYTTNPISTVSYTNVQFEYFMTTHNKYPLESNDKIIFYYSIDNSITNWVPFKEYVGMDGFEYTRKASGRNMDDIINIALPAECDSNIGGIRIKIENHGFEGNSDKVILDEVRIIGTKGTDQPTIQSPSAAPTAPTPSSANVCDSNTPRIRRAYHLLTSEEKKFYTDGINALAAANKFADFAAAHAGAFMGDPSIKDQYGQTIPQAHGTSVFLAWHRWFIWELESQIRAIPGFECWTHAYWDIGAENEAATQEGPWWICSAEAQFGGYGDDSSYCIAPPFESVDYFGNCIRRKPDMTRNFPDYAAIFDLIGSYPEYGDVNNQCLLGFRQYLEQREGYHGSMHCWIGGSSTDLCTVHSPSDPAFYLIHAFIDFAWTFWTRCHGKNTLLNFGYCGDVNEVMYYERLSNGDRTWSSYDRINKVRVRDVLDNEILKVVYDVGDFGDPDYEDEIANECPVGSIYGADLINPVHRRLFVPDNRGKSGNGAKGGRPKRSAARIATRNRKKGIFDKFMKDKDGKVKWSRAKHREYVKATCRDDEERLNHHCDLPVSYYNCDDLKDGVNGDIDITLQELLDRIEGSECMKETRHTFYPWAKITQTLRNLCDGVYDPFCDSDELKTRMLTKAAANSIIFESHNNNNNDGNEVDPNQHKYVIFGSIILTVSIFVALCMVCVIRQCHNNHYIQIKSVDLEKEPSSDEEEEEPENEQDLL